MFSTIRIYVTPLSLSEMTVKKKGLYPPFSPSVMSPSNDSLVRVVRQHWTVGGWKLSLRELATHALYCLIKMFPSQ